MKKYMNLCFGLFIAILGSLEVNAMGPVPYPYPTQTSQTYQANPTYRMTPPQKLAVSQAFLWAQNAFLQNHKVCRSRGECLNLDLRSLANFISTHPSHPAQPMFHNIYNIIRLDSQHQKFVSQWVIFQNLSPSRQSEYRNGLRIDPIQPQYARAPWGMTWVSTPAFFNQDDVLTDLLQEVDHYHKNCNQFLTCLRGDLQIINNLYNRLATNDPVRLSLRNLSQNISNSSTRSLFNTTLYLNLYNPLSPDWNNTLTKHKAHKLASDGYTQWHQIEKSSRPASWQPPRLTNGTPILQNQPSLPTTPINKNTLREWWREKRNIFWR